MLDRRVALQLVHDREHYEMLVDRLVRDAQVSVWISRGEWQTSTANFAKC